MFYVPALAIGYAQDSLVSRHTGEGRYPRPGGLSDLKGIACKSTSPVQIAPLFLGHISIWAL